MRVMVCFSEDAGAFTPNISLIGCAPGVLQPVIAWPSSPLEYGTFEKPELCHIFWKEGRSCNLD